jgi:hypothetical protein
LAALLFAVGAIFYSQAISRAQECDDLDDDGVCDDVDNCPPSESSGESEGEFDEIEDVGGQVWDPAESGGS